MMTRARKKYDKEFKRKAVELSMSIGNAREIAEEIGFAPQLLYRWRREYENYEGNSFPGMDKPKMRDQDLEIALLI